MQELNELLEERQKTHGKYEDNCFIGMGLLTWCMEALNNNEEYKKLSTKIQANIMFTVIMNQFKITRMVTGDPLEPEHAKDAAGYLMRFLETLETSGLKDNEDKKNKKDQD